MEFVGEFNNQSVFIDIEFDEDGIPHLKFHFGCQTNITDEIAVGKIITTAQNHKWEIIKFYENELPGIRYGNGVLIRTGGDLFEF